MYVNNHMLNCTRTCSHQTIKQRNVSRQCNTRTVAPIESIRVRREVDEIISVAIDKCLTSTHLQLPNKREGKVRDTYDLGDKIVVVTTDRQSAFDRLIASIPFKGQVLNQTSAWWFNQTQHIIDNAILSVPDPNVMVMQKCSVFPVEFVVRGFLTGSTNTSLWTHYAAGMRDYCGNTFTDGMVKNQRLMANVITPTTKSHTHDKPIAPDDIIERGLMTKDEWEVVSNAAFKLFEFGQRQAEKRGLLLVDTKYEFGKTSDDRILLIDEIHTPDSSRYWIADSYEERMSKGKEPENIDKEFLRLWFRSHCDPYNDIELPIAPRELVEELSRRYILLYERITGENFVAPNLNEPTIQRIKHNLTLNVDLSI